MNALLLLTKHEHTCFLYCIHSSSHSASPVTAATLPSTSAVLLATFSSECFATLQPRDCCLYDGPIITMLVQATHGPEQTLLVLAPSMSEDAYGQSSTCQSFVHPTAQPQQQQHCKMVADILGTSNAGIPTSWGVWQIPLDTTGLIKMAADTGVVSASSSAAAACQVLHCTVERHLLQLWVALSQSASTSSMRQNALLLRVAADISSNSGLHVHHCQLLAVADVAAHCVWGLNSTLASSSISKQWQHYTQQQKIAANKKQQPDACDSSDVMLPTTLAVACSNGTVEVASLQRASLSSQSAGIPSKKGEHMLVTTAKHQAQLPGAIHSICLLPQVSLGDGATHKQVLAVLYSPNHASKGSNVISSGNHSDEAVHHAGAVGPLAATLLSVESLTMLLTVPTAYDIICPGSLLGLGCLESSTTYSSSAAPANVPAVSVSVTSTAAAAAAPAHSRSNRTLPCTPGSTGAGPCHVRSAAVGAMDSAASLCAPRIALLILLQPTGGAAHQTDSQHQALTTHADDGCCRGAVPQLDSCSGSCVRLHVDGLGPCLCLMCDPMTSYGAASLHSSSDGWVQASNIELSGLQFVLRTLQARWQDGMWMFSLGRQACMDCLLVVQ